MASRERILGRLRGVDSLPRTSELPTPADSDLFSDAGVSSQGLLAQFEERFTALRGEFHLAARDAAAGILKEILDTEPAGSVLVQSSPWLDEILSGVPDLASRSRRVDAGAALPSPDFASYVAGISTAEYLVARTGSLVVRSDRNGGRRLSVLPPLHVVVARREQLVTSLEDLMPALGADPAWTSVALVTGPSRTADIEKILVLGAHGPKRLACVVVD